MLELSALESLANQAKDLGTAINGHLEKKEKVPYKLTKEIRKVAQLGKVEFQKIRVAAAALNKK